MLKFYIKPYIKKVISNISTSVIKYESEVRKLDWISRYLKYSNFVPFCIIQFISLAFVINFDNNIIIFVKQSQKPKDINYVFDIQ